MQAEMDELELEAIQRLTEPIFEETSTELVDLKAHRHADHVVLRFLVDKVGGMTIQDCANLNRRLGHALDSSGVLEERYMLEVSSPGLDRPLASKRDFERALGEDVELELLEPIRDSKQLKGQLLSVLDDAIVLISRLGNVTIPLQQIRRAVKAVRL